MEWVNYHHLLYFWMVAREGGVGRAAAQLRLAQPTISAQIHQLEDQLGEKLFSRQGRNLVLTEVGQVVYRYADEIFSLGREMMDVVHNRPVDRPLPLTVGIASAVPKLIAYRLLEPALLLQKPVQLACVEDSTERLLGQLASHQLDIVISDAPATPGMSIRAFNHRLGQTTVSVFGTARLVTAHRRNFPKSLHGAPLLLPSRAITLRRLLDAWFEQQDIRPNIIAEFDDSGLLKAFGQGGAGLFFSPTAIAREVQQQYDVKLLSEVKEVSEDFYAITVERRIRNPAVIAISRAARQELFTGPA